MTSQNYEERVQTAVKHEILERYLKGFVPVVGDWAADIAYIDCLAGPWQSVDPNMKDTSFARAISALRSGREKLQQRDKSPSIRCLFVEKNGSAFDKLKQYCETVSDIEVTARHWNFASHIQDIAKFVHERDRTFPFIFIDPTGWDALEIELIRPILSLRPGEVLINLMTSFITRFLSVPEKRFEKLFKDDMATLAGMSGEEQEEAIVASYARQVRQAGKFNYVCTLPVMKSTEDAFYFHMIYATRDVKGVEVFKETEEHVIPFMQKMRAYAQERKRYSQTGQGGLFGPEVSYKETRFTRYRARSLELAKSQLRANLAKSLKLSYDEAWALAMQHSAVLETDVRLWLAEWEAAGLLEITNRQPRQRFPNRNRGQHLVWKGARK